MMDIFTTLRVGFVIGDLLLDHADHELAIPAHIGAVGRTAHHGAARIRVPARIVMREAAVEKRARARIHLERLARKAEQQLRVAELLRMHAALHPVAPPCLIRTQAEQAEHGAAELAVLVLAPQHVNHENAQDAEALGRGEYPADMMRECFIQRERNRRERDGDDTEREIHQKAEPITRAQANGFGFVEVGLRLQAR